MLPAVYGHTSGGSDKIHMAICHTLFERSVRTAEQPSKHSSVSIRVSIKSVDAHVSVPRYAILYAYTRAGMPYYGHMHMIYAYLGFWFLEPLCICWSCHPYYM